MNPLTFIQSDLCQQWARTLARRFWEDLDDDRLAAFLAGVPDPHVRAAVTVAQVLLSRFPNCRRYTETQRLTLLEALTTLVVASLIVENSKRTAAREKVSGRAIRRWIAAGEPTPEDLRTLVRHGQRRRYNPDGPKESAAMYQAALVERVTIARQQHFEAPLREQFLNFWNGVFDKVARRADNSVRDQIRAIRFQRAGECSTDFDEPSAQTLDGLPVMLAKEPGTSMQLLAELRQRASLTKREGEVIELLLQDLSQVQIAGRLRVSQQRVSQLTKQAIERMREHVRSHT